LRTTLAALTVIIVFCQLIPPASCESVLKCGGDDVVAVLVAPSFLDTINLSVPSDRYLLHATMTVSSMAGAGSPPEYPEYVSVVVNDSTVWAFQGTGYGPLGKQNLFSNGNQSAQVSAATGGTSYPPIRLPQNAVVQKATIELTSTPQQVWKRMINLTGRADDDRMGRSVSCAGDVNGDGFKDAIACAQQNDAGGANSGQAYIYFGNYSLDNVVDVMMTGTSGERLGVSCAGAGDVNGDGYDDVIVGAHYNSSLGAETGRACIFFGGLFMDNIADVVLSGAASGDQFGIDVSGGGDLNNDGYDDVIVGGHLNDVCGTEAGRAYIYFGGNSMDSVADVILNGSSAGDMFGNSVSVAGDINGDGYDDVIVGASYNDSTATDAGAAYIFFGGSNMDAVADVNLSGTGSVDRFGVAVAGAGDVNGDGFCDVIVGSINDDTIANDAGAAYIYLGGPGMDSQPDVKLYGTGSGDNFANAVAGSGDVNNDGFDDVVVGAPNNDDAGTDFGKAYVFFGGPNMDSIKDGNFTGAATDDGYGNCGRGGDYNGDGVDDVIIGAPRFDGSGSNIGRAYIFSYNHPIIGPEITIMSMSIWKKVGYFVGSNLSQDFSTVLNDCLALSVANYTDDFGNSFADLQPIARAANEGNITIFNLSITYSYEAIVPDFSSELNGYIATNDCAKDAGGNFSVPMKARSHSAGRVKLSGLNFTADLAPSLVREIGTLEMDEDCINASICDLYYYFQDDYDSDAALNFSIVCATNASLVKLSLDSSRYLFADAATGSANDNWTGTVDAVIDCTDSRGQTTQSNRFTIIVRNVNDPPVITSAPKKSAEPGMPYYYNVTARDGDNDTLHFSLNAAPADMTIEPETGQIQWLPTAKGNPAVVVAVEDAVSSAQQSYSISVPNRPPIITSAPPLNANVSVPYIYNILAVDPNNDTLRYELASGPSGMAVNPITGVLTWTPGAGGKYDVVVRVNDGSDKTVQNFSILAIQGNRAPQIKSTPAGNATVDVAYMYNISASDSDGDALAFSIQTGPSDMTVDASRGTVAWTPSTPGNYSVFLKVSDGNGGEALQEFVIKVAAATRPRVTLTSPRTGETLKGESVFSGTVKKGSRELVSVQMRIDGNEWSEVGSNYSWNHTADTRALKNGKHVFEFRAYDGKEYSDIVKAELNVDNPVVTSSKGFIPMLDTLAALLLGLAVVVLATLRRGSARRDH
jgi:hypothetical protein